MINDPSFVKDEVILGSIQILNPFWHLSNFLKNHVQAQIIGYVVGGIIMVTCPRDWWLSCELIFEYATLYALRPLIVAVYSFVTGFDKVLAYVTVAYVAH